MIEDGSDFKVADRRIFAEDGTIRKDSAVNPKPEDPKTENPKTDVPKTEVHKTEVHKTEATTGKGFSGAASPLNDTDAAMPMTFQTLVLSLSTTAMLQMGLLAPKEGENTEHDLEGAKQTIDILQILQQKTTGNLTEEESQLLETSLFDLKMWYLKATNNVRL